MDDHASSSRVLTFTESDVFLNFDFDNFLEPQYNSPLTFNAILFQPNQDKNTLTGTKQLSNEAQKLRLKRQKIDQIHICKVHPTRDSIQCFGVFSSSGKYKGARCKRRVSSFIEDQLPVCSHHRAQVMKMVKCEAILEDCELPCGQIIAWEPHSYPLCGKHWSQGGRYFENLPVEIRLMIYDYLIPDRKVSATRYCGRYNMRLDGSPVSTALFRVNQAIHDEFADVFYGKPTYEIEVKKQWELRPACKMCFQQTMCLTMNLHAESGRFQYDFDPWVPPIPLRYFERIRSIHLDILLDSLQSYPLSFRNTSNPALAMQSEAERDSVCDELYRFTDRVIQSNLLPLRSLSIKIRVEDRFIGTPQAGLQYCKSLLSPIKRLLPKFVGFKFTRVDAGSDYVMFDESKTSGLSWVIPVPPKDPILVRFGQLVQLLNQMGQHPFWRETDIEQMEFFLSNGRAARESASFEAMREVFLDVFKMLQRYNKDHARFMLSIRETLEALSAVPVAKVD